MVSQTKKQRAAAVLASAKAAGCKATLDGQWITWTPPLPTWLLLQSMDLGDELAEIIRKEQACGS